MKTAKALSIDGSSVSTRPGWRGKTFAERFWARVDRSGGEVACWPWLGPLNHRGYGTCAIPGHASELVHRVASVLAQGPLAAGELVLHRNECTTKRCTNPAHLYRGDQKQNMKDAVAAGVMHGRNVSRGDDQWLRKRAGQVVRDTKGRVAGIRHG
jgi:hypothetical protein